MNKLPLATRVQILSMLCEGSSMRSISRVADVSINTVSKLLVDAGKACAAFHDDGRWHQPNALERDGYSEHGGSGGPEAGKARPL